MLKSAFTAVAVLAVLAVQPAAAQSRQDFTLINATGYTIDEVYVAPSSSDDWQEDVMGDDALENNTQVHITFSRKEKTCAWDLLVVYDDGEKAEWEGFDLCKVSDITIRYDRGSGRTWAEYK